MKCFYQIRSVLVCAMASLLFFSCNEAKSTKKEVKFVLQITVDGLRGDLLERYKDQLTDDGFIYLMNSGVYFTNAHYQHANTETIVGHTTLATGTTPSNHGMVGNVWFDEKTREIGYNIEDPEAPLLPTRKKQLKSAQLDPAQKASRSQGRSPKAILTQTFSDELYKSGQGKSKIFAISGKDRGAVPLAGHKGKAFWYSTDNGDFISSKFYYDSYPQWVIDWNNKRQAEKIAGTKWNLMNDIATYQFKDQDNRPYEVDLKGYGKIFPHSFGKLGDPLLYTQILVSPLGDHLLLDFAKTLIEKEGIGKDQVTDFLAVSFSGVDAVNHFFGPSSLENEDMVLQLDKTLAKLLKYVDTQIGLEHTLIVLSADHGMAEMPEYMNEKGMDVGRIYSEDIVSETNKIAKKIYGLDSIAKSFFRPSLYLNEDIIDAAGLSVNEVEDTIAKELTKMKGISTALSRAQIADTSINPNHQKIKNTYHPHRSGNIYVAQEPYWFLFEKGPIGVMHGSPWDYDTHVPIFFSGPAIPQLRVDRLVHPADIVPTLSDYLEQPAPKSSTGSILKEINN